jgi:hypothetical protein
MNIHSYSGYGISVYLEKILYHNLYVDKYSAKPTFIDFITAVQSGNEFFYNHHDNELYSIKDCMLYIMYTENTPIAWVFSYVDDKNYVTECVYWRYVKEKYRNMNISRNIMKVATNNAAYKDTYNVLRTIK